MDVGADVLEKTGRGDEGDIVADDVFWRTGRTDEGASFGKMFDELLVVVTIW